MDIPDVASSFFDRPRPTKKDEKGRKKTKKDGKRRKKRKKDDATSGGGPKQLQAGHSAFLSQPFQMNQSRC